MTPVDAEIDKVTLYMTPAQWRKMSAWNIEQLEKGEDTWLLMAHESRRQSEYDGALADIRAGTGRVAAEYALGLEAARATKKVMLAAETVRALTDNGMAPADVERVLFNEEMSWCDFAAFMAAAAGVVYYPWHGVDSLLKVVGGSWWLERARVDGDQVWVFQEGRLDVPWDELTRGEPTRSQLAT